MATFTWTPEFGAQVSNEPKIRRAKFGDGYEQRVPDSMNYKVKMYDLTFANRSIAECDAIEAFLNTEGGAGVNSFDWTPPRASSAIKVKCERWNRNIGTAAYDTITAQFEEVFEP